MPQKRIKCIYPKCLKNQIAHQSINNLCPEHTKSLEFFIWVLNNYRIRTEKDKNTNSGLWIP